jgi:tetratricopeptide (TPR) repeat protein
MSLLLDALKKSGAAESKSHGQSEMPAGTAGGSPSYAGLAQSPNADKTNSTRAAGENLFAAKKTPEAKRPRLGIIPIALIVGGILAASGGYYVYLEITPPNQRFYHHNSPATAARVAPAPISVPQPVVTTMQVAQMPAAEVAPPVAGVSSISQPPARKTAAPKSPQHNKKTAGTNNNAVEIQRTQESDSIDLVLSSAYQAYQNGDYATAWQRYRMAYGKDPKNRDALLGLAVIAQQQGQDDTALHYYRQVLLLDPRDPVARAALFTFGGSDPATKESSLKLLISQQPDAAVLYFALGNQYSEQLRWSDAQQAYANALTLEPANALFAFNLASSLDHLGQRKAAVRYYQQALQFDTTGHAGFSREQAQQRANELGSAGR